ncbi:MAG TPA: condensation domain-containing protein, partial [Terriglobia bacterium]|nr:condensation domain-containing protein [Terriglobia bacterium]
MPGTGPAVLRTARPVCLYSDDEPHSQKDSFRESGSIETDDAWVRIADKVSEEEERLAVQVRPMVVEGVGGQSIMRRVCGGSCPLSFAQERLWFLDQLEPQSPVYHIAEAVEWKGPLDRNALEKALDALVVRHESLRTVFRSVEGIPVQVVAPARAVPFEIIDLRGHSSDEEEVRRRLKERSRQPFDLSRDLMLRATLLQVGEDEYWLLLV